MSQEIANTLLQLGHHFSPKMVRLAGYLGREEIAKILEPLKAGPKRLEPYGLKIFSQGDEDGILQEIFRRIGITRGTALEIGVQGGVECNSHLLLYKGWKCHWFEGSDYWANHLKSKFQDMLSTGQLSFTHTFVTKENLQELLVNVPEDVDFVGIDVDGNDYYFFEALHLKPKVVCIEYNALFPPGLSLVQQYNPTHVWCGSSYFGASLTAMTRLAHRLGYTLVGTNIVGTNAFFVRNDLVGDNFCSPATPEVLYNPPRYWLIQDVFTQCGHPPDHGPFVHVPEE
jgi:hypothetical protein